VILLKLLSLLQKNSFFLSLLAVLMISDLLISWWNPMESSRRFYKNDYTKTLYHHGWSQSGPVFFGNSAVTGAYMEEKSSSQLVEFGLSYGKPTDLKAIIQQDLYQITDQLVVGIDVHTMLDPLQTDPTYQWFKPWYQPYVYRYRDYFRDSGEELALNLIKQGSLAYEPRWIDKELYYGRKDTAWLTDKWKDYDQRFGSMTLKDFQESIDAIGWIVDYAADNKLPLRVIWMPWHPGYQHPPYVAPLKEKVNGILQAAHIPVLDVMDTYKAELFHDLVHLNREEGAPIFTKEVDAWLDSLKNSSKS
jgi:hypothetical protein